MGTGSFPGVKRPGRGVDHPPTSSAEVKERVELYLYSPSGPSWPVLGRTLILPLTPNLCTAGGHFQGSANDKVLLSQSALGSLCWSRQSASHLRNARGKQTLVARPYFMRQFINLHTVRPTSSAPHMRTSTYQCSDDFARAWRQRRNELLVCHTFPVAV
jgi:hypothetical protein